MHYATYAIYAFCCCFLLFLLKVWQRMESFLVSPHAPACFVNHFHVVLAAWFIFQIKNQTLQVVKRVNRNTHTHTHTYTNTHTEALLACIHITHTHIHIRVSTVLITSYKLTRWPSQSLVEWCNITSWRHNVSLSKTPYFTFKEWIPTNIPSETIIKTSAIEMSFQTLQKLWRA
jgi:hypothetical protein